MRLSFFSAFSRFTFLLQTPNHYISGFFSCIVFVTFQW